MRKTAYLSLETLGSQHPYTVEFWKVKDRWMGDDLDELDRWMADHKDEFIF